MKHILQLIILSYLFQRPAYAQVDCSNVGFEQGNANGWVFTYGAVTDANQQTNFAASDRSLGWDGTCHGEKTDPGVYPYKIRVELANGAFLNYKGVVNLLR